MASETLYGQRLLVNVVEARAEHGHPRPYASIPVSDDPRDGFRPVTYRMLRDAADRMAWYLDEQLGPAKAAFETFAFIGPATDMRYLLLVLAAMKTRRRAFFPSPRNSLEAHLALLKGTACSAIFEPTGAPMPIVHNILENQSLRHFQMPPLDDFLADSTESGRGPPPRPYPYTRSFEDARLEPCLVLHTSGSTGLPKPISIKNGWFTTCDAYHLLPSLGADEPGVKAFEGLRMFCPFPNFHSAAVIFKLANAIFWDFTVIEPTNAPLTAELADACHVHSKAEASFLPSSILRDLTHNQQALENLENLRYVAFSGSPLAEEVGEVVQRRVHIINIFGITELCMAPFEKVAPEDWSYLKFGPHTGVEFRPVSDDQFEMVMVRKPALDLFQANFVTEPNIQEWPTKDVWTKHPTKPFLWHYQGRIDDIIIFENGEKLNPTTMQETISSHPAIAGALVGGSGRFQSFLLVEPHQTPTTDEERSSLVDKIWPIVQEANASAVAHGRISKGLMMFTTHSRPLLRADKGSIKKKASLDLYSAEIERLYQDFSQGLGMDIPPLDLSTFESSKKSLRDIISIQTEIADLDDDTDFFSLGMDSLQASNLVRTLMSASSGSVKLETREVYANSTLIALAAYISGTSPSSSTGAVATKSREDQMSTILAALTQDLPVNARRPLVKQPRCILLTGSTGSLGSYLLDLLLRDSTVDKIYCLNRSEDSLARQTQAHESRGLTRDLSKARFIHAPDFSKPFLSVNEEDYKAMLADVTHVIHNAWPVDFNRGLLSFESHIRGVRRVVDFCAASSRNAAVSFLGTIASAGNWRGASLDDKVPEQIFAEWSTSQDEGYASSKHVSEMLLHSAARSSEISATVVRLGQVAGPVAHGEHGMWNKQEWLPTLIASSVYLGKLPSTLGAAGVVDWMPVDLLAHAILQVVLGAEASEATGQGALVRHFVNPSAASWSDLVPSIVASLPENRRPQVVSLEEWLASLRDSASKNELAANPALKLLPFYEGLGTSGARLATLDTTQAARESEALRTLHKVDSDWMGLWMRQWRFS